MKNTILITVLMLSCGSVFASTDHYLRRDGGHVQHLKITKLGNDVSASMDVDFEPTNAESDKGTKPCSVQVAGEVKVVGEGELVLKKQIPEEARYCSVQILLSGDEARTKQSDDCKYFLANFCKFDSEGKPLLRMK
jgi:hypothetical protein